MYVGQLTCLRGVKPHKIGAQSTDGMGVGKKPVREAGFYKAQGHPLKADVFSGIELYFVLQCYVV